VPPSRRWRAASAATPTTRSLRAGSRRGRRPRRLAAEPSDCAAGRRYVAAFDGVPVRGAAPVTVTLGAFVALSPVAADGAEGGDIDPLSFCPRPDESLLAAARAGGVGAAARPGLAAPLARSAFGFKERGAARGAPAPPPHALAAMRAADTPGAAPAALMHGLDAARGAPRRAFDPARERAGEVFEVVALFLGASGRAFAHVRRVAPLTTTWVGDAALATQLVRTCDCATVALGGGAVAGIVRVADVSPLRFLTEEAWIAASRARACGAVSDAPAAGAHVLASHDFASGAFFHELLRDLQLPARKRAALPVRVFGGGAGVVQNVRAPFCAACEMARTDAVDAHVLPLCAAPGGGSIGSVAGAAGAPAALNGERAPRGARALFGSGAAAPPPPLPPELETPVGHAAAASGAPAAAVAPPAGATAAAALLFRGALFAVGAGAFVDPAAVDVLFPSRAALGRERAEAERAAWLASNAGARLGAGGGGEGDMRPVPPPTPLRAVLILSAWTTPAGASFVGALPLYRLDEALAEDGDDASALLFFAAPDAASIVLPAAALAQPVAVERCPRGEEDPHHLGQWRDVVFVGGGLRAGAFGNAEVCELDADYSIARALPAAAPRVPAFGAAAPARGAAGGAQLLYEPRGEPPRLAPPLAAWLGVTRDAVDPLWFRQVRVSDAELCAEPRERVFDGFSGAGFFAEGVALGLRGVVTATVDVARVAAECAAANGSGSISVCAEFSRTIAPGGVFHGATNATSTTVGYPCVGSSGLTRALNAKRAVCARAGAIVAAYDACRRGVTSLFVENVPRAAGEAQTRLFCVMALEFGYALAPQLLHAAVHGGSAEDRARWTATGGSPFAGAPRPLQRVHCAVFSTSWTAGAHTMDVAPPPFGGSAPLAAPTVRTAVAGLPPRSAAGGPGRVAYTAARVGLDALAMRGGALARARGAAAPTSVTGHAALACSDAEARLCGTIPMLSAGETLADAVGVDAAAVASHLRKRAATVFVRPNENALLLLITANSARLGAKRGPPLASRADEPPLQSGRFVARCHGVPDDFILRGSPHELVWLVGNSVPWPLAVALGDAMARARARGRESTRGRAPSRRT